MSVGNFFIGLILIAIGVICLKFNRQLSTSLGTPEFLYRFFGPGREYAFYAFLSIGLIGVGFFVMFGLFGIITDAILSPFRQLQIRG